MSINTKAIQSQVATALSSYGTEFKVYRDIYITDEIGCRVLLEERREVGSISGVLDNSSTSSKELKNEQRGIVKDSRLATLYVAYSDDILIQPGDYIAKDSVYYRLKPFADIVHYNILYQIQVERLDLNE